MNARDSYFFGMAYISQIGWFVLSDKRNMKLWKLILLIMRVAVLPFALVAVGQAQQLTCWGLRSRVEETEETDNPVPALRQRQDSSHYKARGASLNISHLSLRFLRHLARTS